MVLGVTVRVTLTAPVAPGFTVSEPTEVVTETPETAGATLTVYVMGLDATEVTESCAVWVDDAAGTAPKPMLANLPVLIVAVSCDAAARSIRPPPRSIGLERGVLFEELPTAL